MTTKRVKVNENVHEQLLYLKKQSNAKSINNIIEALLFIAEEHYLSSEHSKRIILEYNKGVLVEIRIKR